MKIKQSLARFALVGIVGGLLACSAEEPAPHVSIVQPVDGATVGRAVKVVMAVDGMKLHEAGEIIPGTGHFDLIVDGGYAPMGELIVDDREHHHFEKGESEGTIHLLPGDHVLTLQFANGHDKSYGHALGHSITVHVK